MKTPTTMPLDKPTAKVILGALDFCAAALQPPAIGFHEDEQAQLDAATAALLARLKGEFPQLATAANYPGLFRAQPSTR